MQLGKDGNASLMRGQGGVFRWLLLQAALNGFSRINRMLGF
jgi:hypothetical protein